VADGLDDELDGLVLDEEFVRLAPVIELRAHERRTAAIAAAKERAARERRALSVPATPKPPPWWTPVRRKVGVAVAALTALAALMAGLKALGVNQDRPRTAATDATAAAVAGQTDVAGDCVTWPDSEGDFATRIGIEVVDCADEHRLEMLGTVTLEEGPYPTPGRFSELFDERCPALARTHLGHDLDPAGRFAIGGLYPSIDGWRAGDRGLACAVVLRDSPGNDYATYRGAAADG
jgi:hypothetical protein